MKSVTLIAVLLVAAAVASADIRLVVEPAAAASRIAGVPVSGFLVKAVMDPGDNPANFAITSIDIRFDGALLQSWVGTYDEDLNGGAGGYTYNVPSAFGSKQATIRDSLFIMNVTAPAPWTGELARAGTEAEDLIGGVPVVVGTGSHLYGAGTWLGAFYQGDKNRMAYGVSGDATTIEVAQLVIRTADLNATGIHIVADMATKTQGGRHFDQYIGAPEPASLGLLAVGGVMALIRRRRA